MNAKYLDIHEEPNKLLGILVTIRARRSYNDVSLTGHAIKQSAEDAEQQDIQRYILISANLVSSRRKLGRDQKRFDVS